MKAEESNVTREPFPRTNPDYSSSSDFLFSETSASWNHAAALGPGFIFVLWKYIFFLSFSPFLTTAKTASYKVSTWIVNNVQMTNWCERGTHGQMDREY